MVEEAFFMSTRPLLCATVAAPTLAELRQCRDAVQGADLIELRLDAVSDPDVAGALAGRRTPVILTCRPTWEGGAFAGSEAERKQILAEALRLGAEYVDIEFAARFDDLISLRRGKGIVLSSHDFEGVPGDLERRAHAMRRTGAEVVKIAIFAHTLSDSLALLPLKEPETKSVLLAMGEAGVATRVLAGAFGSRWTYAGEAHAPGQISLARMIDVFRFRDLNESTDLYGVVGRPLTHSISPAMHNAAFRAAQANAVYVPMTAASAADFLTFADAMQVQGVSITIPFKVDLFQRADDVDPLGRRVGAINTLRRRGTRWEGRNTDVSGFLAPLKGLPSGSRAAVLGTGGAARGVTTALLSVGAKVTVYGRSLEKAAAVASLVDGEAAVLPPPPGSWDLLVNTTPLGTHPKTAESAFEQPFDGSLVYDLVYNPMQTRLLREAAAAGCKTIGGLDMLVAQAEDQSEWWLGHRPPQGVMRKAALDALGIEHEQVARSTL
jgi:3-dehydroquinate dehydratase/shikimate dehydrogenase